MSTVASLMLLAALLLGQAPPTISFTMAGLSIDLDLNGVAVFDGGVVAVGGGGTVAVAYTDGGRLLEKPLEANLLDVSCIGARCLAVGEKGASVLIDAGKGSLRPVKIAGEDLIKVEAYDGRFYVSARREVLVYSLDGEVVSSMRVEALDIAAGGRELYILVRDSLLKIDGDLYTSMKLNLTAEKITWHNGEVYGLARKGLYRLPEGRLIVEGAYERITSCGELYLTSGGTIYSLEDGGLEVFNVLQFKPRDLACRGGELYAVGEKGFYAKVLEEKVELLFAPSGKYSTVSADRGLAYIAGDKVLSYVDGMFKIVETPSTGYTASSTSNGEAALLSPKKIVIVSEGWVRTLPYVVEEYLDVWLQGGSLLLAGRKGLVQVSVDELAVRELLGGVELYAVNWYGAAGKNVLAVISQQTVETVKVNGTLRGLDKTPCGLVAVGDNGLVAAYRDGAIEYYWAPAKEKLKSVAVKPDGSYALIGGSGGGLYFWDGYRVYQLPYTAPGEVSDIAWISDREALITAGGKLLMFRETGSEKPRLHILAPDTVKMYNGTSREVQVSLQPVNGYSGEVDIVALIEGIEGVSLELEREKLYIKPLCPATLSLEVSASPYTTGSGRIQLYVGGEEEDIALVVEPKTGRTQTTKSILEDWTTLSIIAAAATILVIPAALLISKMFKKLPRREAPKPEEKGWEKPQEGEEEEW